MGVELMRAVRASYWADKLTPHQRFLLEGMAFATFDDTAKNRKANKEVGVFKKGTAYLADEVYGHHGPEECDKISKALKKLKDVLAIEEIRPAAGRWNHTYYAVHALPEDHMRVVQRRHLNQVTVCRDTSTTSSSESVHTAGANAAREEIRRQRMGHGDTQNAPR